MRGKILLVVAVVALLLGACGVQEEAGQNTSLVEKAGKAPYYTVLADALEACGPNQYVVAEFYTDWCIWCKTLDSVVFSDPKAIDFFTNDMILARINAEVDTASRNKYYARAYPTSIVLDKAGNEVDRFVGFDSTDAYLKAIVDYTHGIGTLQDLLSKAEGTTDRSLMMQIVDKYKYRGMFNETNEWCDRVITAGDPTDSLSGEARMAQAYMLRKAEDLDGALAAFAAIAKDFDSYHGREAVIWEGIVLEQKNDTAAAVKMYQSFIDKFGTIDDEGAEYCKQQIEELSNPPDESEH